MISTGKSINLNYKSKFFIPSIWRKKFNILDGSLVKMNVHENYIIIEPLKDVTTDIISTVGRGGNIYIPKEIRNHFYFRGVFNFNIFADEERRAIIIMPEN